MSPSAIHAVVGSKPRSVTDPDPKVRSAAITRSPDIASDRPAPGSPAYAASVAASSGTPPRIDRSDAGIDVEAGGRAVGEQVVGERGQHVRARRPADDDEAPAARDPGAERGELGRLESAEVSMSCQTSRSRADQAWMRSGRSAGVSGTMTGATPFWLGSEVELPDDPGRVLGDDAHDELGLVVERDRDRRLDDDLVARDELDLHVAAERRRLCIQQVLLARARRQLRRASRTSSAESEPPAIRSSPVTVGPAFSRSTAMANHEPARTWPWRSARAVIVRPLVGGRRGGRRRRQQGEQDEHRGGEAEDDPGRA